MKTTAGLQLFTMHYALSTIHCPFDGSQMGGAPLLPKLRGYFVEFLRKVSLARLSLLDSPTCVGLRYGRPGERSEAFLGKLSGDPLRPKPRLSLSLT